MTEQTAPLITVETPLHSGPGAAAEGQCHRRLRLLLPAGLLALLAWLAAAHCHPSTSRHVVGVVPRPAPVTARSSFAYGPGFRAAAGAQGPQRGPVLPAAADDDKPTGGDGDTAPAGGWPLTTPVLSSIVAAILLLGAGASLAAITGAALEVPSLGQLCGASSVAIWVVSQVPQMVKNQQRRKAEDLSIDFLLLWTLGDVCNLAGCFLIEGTATQRVLAVYFIFCNVVLLTQWWQFGRGEAKGSGMSAASRAFWLALTGGAGLGLARCLLLGLPKALIGDYLGWVSGAVYLISRLPQIWKNFATKQVDDLSPFLFILAALGNTTYAASILAVSLAPDWLRMQAPFLVGSIGTLVFDAVLLLQIKLYRQAVPGGSSGDGDA